MKHKLISVASTLSISLLLPLTAHAELFDRGGGLIYDSDQNITWVKDVDLVVSSGRNSDGRLNWIEAKAWADNLEYRGYSDWRLPKFRDELTAKPGCDRYPSTTYDNSDCGSNTNTSLSELAYLFHNILGNVSMRDRNGTWGQCPSSGTYCLINKGADGVTFDQLDSVMTFWTDTYVESTDKAIWFGYTYGMQGDSVGSSGAAHVWVVRDGDSSIADPVFDITDIVNAPLNTQMVTNTVTITGIHRQLPISISGGSYKINDGFWTSEPSTVGENDRVTLKILSSSQMGTTTSASLTIGNTTDVANVTTIAPDNTPEPFYLNDANNAELSTNYNSNVITVLGINAPTAISVVGGEYAVNGGAWTSAAGSVVEGDTFIVRRTSSANYSTTVSAVLTVGTYSDSFDITTKAFVPDTTPESFLFIDVLNAEPNTAYQSNTITVLGVNTDTPVSIVGGEYRINGGVWRTAAGIVIEGDMIEVRRNAPSAYSTAVSTQLTVGNISDSFDITTRAADLTVDPFTFVDKTNAELNTTYTSNAITLSGPEQAVSISIVGGQYRINGGSWTSAAGTISAGDSVAVRRNSSTEFSTAVATTLTIGSYSDSFDITTKAVDTAPSIFSFTDVTNAEVDTLYISNTVTISGINTDTPVSIVGGEYRINGGSWMTAAGSVTEGDMIEVRRNSSTEFSTAVAATLTVGTYSDSFDITTKVADITPNAFSFVDVSNATVDTLYTSNTVTISGINTDTPVSIVGGEYRVNSGSWTSVAGTISAGDSVVVRRNSSTEFSTSVSAILSVGTISDAFDITTMDADTTPHPFTFNDVSGAELSTSYTSNTITVLGVNTDTPVSILAGEYRINGGSWTSAAASAVEGDTIEVRRNSSSEYSTLVGTMLTVGTYSDSFDITTMNEPDITPEPFTFVDVVDAEPDQQYVSNTVTITGIDTAVEVSITGGEYRYNAGIWTNQPQYVVDGDTLEVRRNSSSENSVTVSAVLMVGTMSDSFDITTKDPVPEVCNAPEPPPLDPAEQAKLVKSELAGLEFSLDIWDSWSTGYCADIVVTNTNDNAKAYPYGVHFTLPADTQFTGTWNGDVQRDGENVTIIFPSWTQYVEANSKTLDNEQFGFCAKGISQPEAYEHYVPDFSNLTIDFIAHNQWDGGYCGHFELTYSGDEPYIPAPNTFNFTLSESVEITEYWNEVYTRDGDTVTVELPFWTHDIYRNSTLDPESGFCVVGDQLPCGAGYTGGGSHIVELTDVEDTYVASGSAGTNYGDYPRVQADGWDDNYDEYVSLLKWDLSELSQGVAITSAQLTLNIYNDGGQYGVYAMNGQWSEYGATWNNTNIESNQGVLLGVIETGASGETSVNFNERGVALVQQWVDSGENHGLMIRSMGTHDGILIRSREKDDGAERAKLSVTYKKDAEPAVMPSSAKLTEGVNGYTGTQDSHVKSGWSGKNYNGLDSVEVDGLSGSSETVALLKWNLSSIPSSAHVVGAEITLSISDLSTGQYNLYAMEGSWREGRVTWDNANVDDNQGVLIGRLVPAQLNTYTVVLNNSGVDLVQAWVDGSVRNRGLMIRSAGTTSKMAFHSSEYGDMLQRPTINVTYY